MIWKLRGAGTVPRMPAAGERSTDEDGAWCMSEGPRRMMRLIGLLSGGAGQARLLAALWVAGALAPLALVPLLSVLQQRGLRITAALSLDAYRDLVETGRWVVVLRTLEAAAIVTAICLVLGFPFAFWLAKRARSRLVVESVRICLTVPFFLDPAARTLALRTLLGAEGPVNALLQALHLTQAPVSWLLFSDFAVYLGLIGPYFPNMVWPLYLSLMLIGDDLFEASRDLGASPGQTLRFTVLPLALPGIVAGIVFTFVPILGDGVVPALLGGGKQEYLADTVMSLSTSMNYSGAAAVSTILLALGTALGALFWRLGRSRAAS